MPIPKTSVTDTTCLCYADRQLGVIQYISLYTAAEWCCGRSCCVAMALAELEREEDSYSYSCEWIIRLSLLISFVDMTIPLPADLVIWYYTNTCYLSLSILNLCEKTIKWMIITNCQLTLRLVPCK